MRIKPSELRVGQRYTGLKGPDRTIVAIVDNPALRGGKRVDFDIHTKKPTTSLRCCAITTFAAWVWAKWEAPCSP